MSVTITVRGIEIALDTLPDLIDSLDGALVIDRRNHVLRVSVEENEAYGGKVKSMRVDDLTVKGYPLQAWRMKEPPITGPTTGGGGSGGAGAGRVIG